MAAGKAEEICFIVIGDDEGGAKDEIVHYAVYGTSIPREFPPILFMETFGLVVDGTSYSCEIFSLLFSSLHTAFIAC